MQRTYYIRYQSVDGVRVDKLTHKSPEDRCRFHKVEALNVWKSTHKGYGWMTIASVFTKEEMKANGYM